MVVSALSRFHFLHPAWLLALPVLAVLAGLAWWHRSQRDGTWARLVDSPLRPLMRLGGGGGERSAGWLIAAAWTAAVLALAGPTWQHAERPGYRAPAAWVLLLDLSPSMTASDVWPSRVARARYAIENLLSRAEDARVALVVFAGDPYTVTPLTTDVATIRSLLQPLAPGLMPEAGHRLAPALAAAQRLLHRGGAGHGQVIVVSDGFTDPAPALAAAARLRAAGDTVNVVGVGTRGGAPERDAAGDFVRAVGGAIVVSRLERARLERIAAAGGGRYVSVAGLAQLITALNAARAHAIDTGLAAGEARIASWRNEGIWLLPGLLLLTALFARRGWL